MSITILKSHIITYFLERYFTPHFYTLLLIQRTKPVKGFVSEWCEYLVYQCEMNRQTVIEGIILKKCCFLTLRIIENIVKTSTFYYCFFIFSNQFEKGPNNA